MQLLILAKRPVPGRAKTRLMPMFGPDGSAALAAAALADTFEAADGSGAERVVVAFDGDPTDVVPAHFEVVPQCDGDLATRLAHAWTSMRGPSLQIGMDTPQVTGADLDAAFAALAQPGFDAALGLAVDGGWWAIGLVRPEDVAHQVFAGIPTSRADTGARQLARLGQLGLATVPLPLRRDVDEPADAIAVAATAPGTRFARAVDELLPPDATGRRGPTGRAAMTAIVRTPRHGSGPGSGAAASTHLRARLCGRDGTTVALDVAGWTADADDLERRRLARLDGPVLDIGCGPGRLVAALAERGVPALGVDASPAAVRMAVDRNASALVRSVFEPLPGTGRWRSALLFDGNIGIGGDPLRLLQRTRDLLAVAGVAVVETAEPGLDLHRFEARVERGEAVSGWFPWARLGVQALLPLAVETGFDVGSIVEDEGRWFVELVARP